MKNKQVKFTEPFNEQYTLLIDSDMKGVNVVMQSKTQIRWDITVLKITDAWVEIKIILLDHMLLQSNNPLIKEIALLTQTFSRMYNELHLTITHDGKIIDVLNMELIQMKWSQTKTEMEKIIQHSEDIKNIIDLNNAIFTDAAKLKYSIQSNEFFMIYFNHIYGNNLPFETMDVFQNNFFNTYSLQWKCTANNSMDLSNADLMDISVIKKPVKALDAEFCNKAYNQFADKIDLKKLTPTIYELANYKINLQSGKLIEGVVKKTEVADEEKLFVKLVYTIVSDGKKKEPVAELKSEKKALPKERRFTSSLIVTDEEYRQYEKEKRDNAKEKKFF